jgi:hypothetical protein
VVGSYLQRHQAHGDAAPRRRGRGGRAASACNELDLQNIGRKISGGICHRQKHGLRVRIACHEYGSSSSLLPSPGMPSDGRRAFQRRTFQTNLGWLWICKRVRSARRTHLEPATFGMKASWLHKNSMSVPLSARWLVQQEALSWHEQANLNVSRDLHNHRLEVRECTGIKSAWRCCKRSSELYQLILTLGSQTFAAPHSTLNSSGPSVISTIRSCVPPNRVSLPRPDASRRI